MCLVAVEKGEWVCLESRLVALLPSLVLCCLEICGPTATYSCDTEYFIFPYPIFLPGLMDSDLDRHWILASAKYAIKIQLGKSIGMVGS